MSEDPPRRPDGLCACGCGRRAAGVPKRRQKGIPAEAYLDEPFATTECCKRWHGVPFGVEIAKGRRPRQPVPA